MTSFVSFIPTIFLVIRQEDVIMVTPTIAAEARTVVHTQALDIVNNSSSNGIPIIAAIAIANEPFGLCREWVQ